MATLVLRISKGSPLTNEEMDANLSNLNNEIAAKLDATSYTAADVFAKVLTLDGTGSGLDADLLNGLSSASTNTPSTIVARDGSGNFSANLITGTVTNANALNGVASDGILVRTSAGNHVARTIVAGTDISVTNGNGLAGNITVNVGSNVAIRNATATWTATQTFANIVANGLSTDSNNNLFTGANNVVVGSTNGFVYIPTVAGVPTGTPTTNTGRSPLVWDSTNNLLKVYSGGVWRDIYTLVDNSVTSAKLASQSVIASKLATSSINNAVMTNGYVVATATSDSGTGESILVFTLLTLAGATPSASDPVIVTFKNQTLSSPVPSVVSITTSTTLTVLSGSTLGTTIDVYSNLDILLVRTTGAVALAVVNNSGALQLNEIDRISATPVSTSSNSKNVIYSGGTITNGQYRHVQTVRTRRTIPSSSPSWETPIVNRLLLVPPKVKGDDWVYTNSVNLGSVTSQQLISEIPDWVTDVEIMFDSISTNSTSPFILRLTNQANTISTTGYNGVYTVLSSTTTSIINDDGFKFSASVAAELHSGTLRISKAVSIVGGEDYIISGGVASNAVARQSIVNGFFQFTTTNDYLGGLVLTTDAGTALFDGGRFIIRYK